MRAPLANNARRSRQRVRSGCFPKKLGNHDGERRDHANIAGDQCLIGNRRRELPSCAAPSVGRLRAMRDVGSLYRLAFAPNAVRASCRSATTLNFARSPASSAPIGLVRPAPPFAPWPPTLTSTQSGPPTLRRAFRTGDKLPESDPPEATGRLL
jgi:hypothetical protein